MPPFAFAPVVKIVLGAVGTAAVMHWATREMRRINAELDRVRQASEAAAKRDQWPTLRRDPHSGDWRVS